MIRNHVDPRTVSAILGHSRTQETMDTYTHVYNEIEAEQNASSTLTSVIYQNTSSSDVPF